MECSIADNESVAATRHIRFATLADWGIKSNARHIQAINASLHDQKETLDFIVAGGDNYYNFGVSGENDRLWNSTWFDRFQVPALDLPWMAILGNHDYYGNIQAQVDYGKSQQIGAKYWFMPSFYYVLKLNGLSIYFIDSNNVSDEQLEWLQMELSTSEALKIVIGHHHFFSNGWRGDNKNKKILKLKGILQAEKVKAYICGHEHNLQMLQDNGIDYFVLGGGGRRLSGDWNFSYAKRVMFKKIHGYSIHDINLDTDEMTTTFYFFQKNGDSAGKESFITPLV